MTAEKPDRYAILKAWCHWKRMTWKTHPPDEPDEAMIKDIEDLISEVGTLKAGGCGHSVWNEE